MKNNVLETIKELNYEFYSDKYNLFEYICGGNITYVKFMNIDIWDDENYESNPTKEFFIEEAQRIINDIYHIFKKDI